MADMMTFPDTVEEFMEEYKLVDTEQVYTNGTELVPIFRMEQWFEHEKAQLFKEGTTSDLISRQAARHALCKAVHKGEDSPCENQTASCLWAGTRVCDFVREIDALPSVQPEPHEGHWIKHESPDGGEQYECSRCGVLWEFNDGTPEDNEAYFCPKCGAKMTISTK